MRLEIRLKGKNSGNSTSGNLGGEGYYYLSPMIAVDRILTKNVLYLLSYVGLLHFININGGGRIRTHAARKGGRFTVCSD